jgi:hypothetical protein
MVLRGLSHYANCYLSSMWKRAQKIELKRCTFHILDSYSIFHIPYSRLIFFTYTQADIDVIGLLLFAQRHNAHQLAAFCLHFIAKSYGPFSKRPEFSLLVNENLEYVEKHQWPPVSYWIALEEYDKNHNKNTDTECAKLSRGGLRRSAMRWFF